MQPNDPSESSFPMKQNDDKLPHDASVFVGSLPSNIDQGELTRLLLDHLSEHIQIKNIKVVRDSKGGVCAFVQCENAASAISLIQILHSSTPKPFLGRILRYEPARAFRTLLISYRAPTQLVRSRGNNGFNINDEVDIELPSAMRIWKHRNSRFHSILYNYEAVQTEESWDRNNSDDNVAFFHPLKFDEETLRNLASYFGCLEKFSPLQAENPGEGSEFEEKEIRMVTAEHGSVSPHCARRSPIMEKQCWEVKWEHRDDCVSALMTLRRVPHLTVTWAHQPTSTGQIGHPSYHHIPGSPHSPHVQRQVFSSPTSPPSILRPRRDVGDADDFFVANPEVAHDQDLARPYDSLNCVSAARQSTTDSWAEEECNIVTRKAADFSFFGAEGISPTTVSRVDCTRGKVSSLQTPPGLDSTQELGKSDYRPEATCTAPGDVKKLAEDEGQELCMPQTPTLDGLSITPLTPGSQFPITPTSCEADVSQDAFRKGFQSRETENSFKVPRPDRDIDPTTLFVGGLEMFGPGAWDEEKVEKFFSRFGGLESVKVVRPVNSCAAFAFVKFDNPESPARAVFEEHNRVFEGRAMRVQLRDCNPSRNNWKHGRGRGRHHHNHFGTHRGFHFRPPYVGQGHTSLHADKLDVSHAADVSEIQLASLSDNLPSSRLPTESNQSGSNSAQLPALPLDAASSSKDSAPGDKYREWYDASESPTHTPEPSSLGSSVSTAGLSFSAPPYSYPIPTGPYFPPPPWAHPYMPQTPFSVPYYPGYAMYPPATPQPFTSPPSSEASGPATGPQHPWPHMGMYTSYIPYPPVPPRPPLMEQGPQHLATQAPLIPTGFIQNEQGTLIAVYQPEALDRYLAGSGCVSATAAPRHPHAGSPSWGSTLPYPYNMGGADLANNPYSTPNQSQFNTAPAPSQYQPSPAPLRGMSSSPFNTPPPLYRRQGSRRETHQSYNSVRQPRTFNGRLSRGGGPIHNSGHAQPVPEQPVGQPPMRNGEWNRWNSAR